MFDLSLVLAEFLSRMKSLELPSRMRLAPCRRDHVGSAAIVERTPDQRATVCRNPGSRDYRRADEYLRTRLYNCVWPFRRRWNKP
jgi:hypothetical protein